MKTYGYQHFPPHLYRYRYCDCGDIAAIAPKSSLAGSIGGRRNALRSAATKTRVRRSFKKMERAASRRAIRAELED